MGRTLLPATSCEMSNYLAWVVGINHLLRHGKTFKPNAEKALSEGRMEPVIKAVSRNVPFDANVRLARAFDSKPSPLIGNAWY